MTIASFFQTVFRHRVVTGLLGLTAAWTSLSACEDHHGGFTATDAQTVARGLTGTPPEVRPMTAQAVVVNRTAPTDEPTRPVLALSEIPTVDEIGRARVFSEPLVPIGGEPSPEENRALGAALTAFVSGSGSDRVEGLFRFLEDHPKSPWRSALELNLGIHQRRLGYFSQCFQLWESAWEAAREAEDRIGRAYADRALAELIQINAWCGRIDDLDRLLPLTEGRCESGAAREKVALARGGRIHMETEPERAFQCGPFAVSRIIEHLGGSAEASRAATEFPSTTAGTNLRDVRDLARAQGWDAQVACRDPGAAMVFPAVVHWKIDHFGALLSQEGDRIRLQDSTSDLYYGRNLTIASAALDQEASGYFLVSTGALPKGWRPVPDTEAAQIWGRGFTTGYDTDASGGCETAAGGCEGACNPGMPGYSVLLSLVSLRITDIPVGYAPPVGPAIPFELAYTQRDTQVPTIFSVGNLGPRWTHSWYSYVEDDPTVTVGWKDSWYYLPGGGIERTSSYIPPAPPPEVDASGRHYKSMAIGVAHFGGSPGFSRKLADGTVLGYFRSDGAVTAPRRHYLTYLRDPQGNQVNLSYDAQLRLTGITDALGQVTTLSYQDVSDPLKITRVTDPFGRHADFTYDAEGRLESIADVVGLVTTFGFQGAADVITSMTTPYGTTSFAMGESNVGSQYESRWITITDPLGDQERVEFIHGVASVAGSEAQVPTGSPIALHNLYLNYRNTYFWDKKAMKQHPGDYNKARIFHWVHHGSASGSVLQATKSPLESRVWYTYPGQQYSTATTGMTLARPSWVGRVLPDGTTQATKTTYNALGQPTVVVDPLGRETRLTYAANDIDLTMVRQKTGETTEEILAQISYGAEPRLPYAITDAAGETTQLAYNSAGQVTSVVNAKGEATTFAYVNGYLDTLQVNGQTQASLTYDGFGRVHTVMDVDGDVTSFWYDDLDRPVRTDYPDGSFDLISWNRLDAEWIRDREGRWTHVFTNALRQTIAVRDPAGRLTGMQWCLCGSLGRLIDPEGRITRFDYDLQGRLLAKALPDQTKTQLVYDTAGRVTTVTDAKGQVATYAYLLDGRVSSLTFSNAAVPTGGVSYQYDPIFGRLTTMTDDVGSTTYAYHPITEAPAYTVGAGRLASVDGPWSDDTVTYAYDELGRVVSQSIGTGNTSSVVYDALGRVDAVTNVLGLFDYVYEGSTGRVSSLTYPNGQQTTFSYLGQAGLRRLSGIMNRKTSGGVQISHFTYGYDILGRITSWGRSFDGGPTTAWTFAYDRGDQLASAILKDAAQAITASHAYGFDRGGNRTFRQNGGSTVAEVANALNQLTDEQTAGKIRIEGQTDEASTVTINGVPAQTTAGTNAFAGEAAVEPGSNTITVQATDGSGNVRTNHYSYNNANGVGRTFLYDLNGNLVSDGQRAYAWDAADRLVSITWLEGAVQRRSEFSYNGQGQRIRIRETADGAELSNKTYLWVGATIAEERNSSGGTVVKRFLGLGEREGSTNRYYTFDHLGSIREVTNQSRTVLARYDYAPYGERTRLGGSTPSYDCFFGFTGHVHHAPTGFTLTLFRIYDPVTGRWLSRDPIGEAGGVNLYAYVGGDPVNFTDPLGLSACNQWSYGTLRHRKCLEAEAINAAQELGGGTGCASAGGDYSALLTGIAIAGGVALADHLLGGHLVKAVGKLGGSVLKKGGQMFPKLKGIWNRLFRSGPPSQAMQGPPSQVHWGKQGKHIPGHNNFIPGRSPLTADPNDLARYTGTGQQVGAIPLGTAGAKERVDFGYIIGTHNGIPTTNGIIHYDGNGMIHIVPARP